MNFKSILVLGLSVATLGLSLPAHAGDTTTVINSTQDAIITGNENETRQNNKTKVNNIQSGRRNASDTSTTVNSGQTADVQGDYNYTRQNNKTNVNNSIRRR